MNHVIFDYQKTVIAKSSTDLKTATPVFATNKFDESVVDVGAAWLEKARSW